MKNFWTVVNEVIRKADVLLLVLDARLVEETKNAEVEKKVKQLNKPLIYVVTKSDLVTKEFAEKYKKTLSPCVFISSVKFQGTTKLRERILIEAGKIDIKRPTVGVLGYPNVGKSSLINALKGKKAASTSSNSGHTKGVQKIKADNRVMFLDTPGVIPYNEKNPNKLAKIGTVDYNKVKDPELVVLNLIESYPGLLEEYYGVEPSLEPETTIEKIAIKKNILEKGGVADTQRISRAILKEWQEGKIEMR